MKQSSIHSMLLQMGQEKTKMPMGETSNRGLQIDKLNRWQFNILQGSISGNFRFVINLNFIKSDESFRERVWESFLEQKFRLNVKAKIKADCAQYFKNVLHGPVL